MSSFSPQLATASFPLGIEKARKRVLNPLLDPYVTNDAWQVEQKFDGVRMLLSRQGPRNRTMQPLTKPVPTPVRTLGAAMPSGVLIDGELVGETFFVFDLLVNGRLHLPLFQRQAMLRAYLGTLSEHPAVQQVEPATTTRMKQLLLQAALDRAAEGVLLKQRNMAHHNGRSSGWLKVKNTRTVDCVLTYIHRDRAAGDVSVLKDGNWTVIGTVSLNGKDASIHDVVEVEYLHFTSRLVQPRIIRTRTDKSPTECTYDDQL